MDKYVVCVGKEEPETRISPILIEKYKENEDYSKFDFAPRFDSKQVLISTITKSLWGQRKFFRIFIREEDFSPAEIRNMNNSLDGKLSQETK